MKSFRSFTVSKITAAVIVSFALASPASAATVSASNSGWISDNSGANSTGFNGGINNHFAGWESPAELNNWFNFLLPSTSFSNATLYIWNEGSNPDPSPYDAGAFYTVHEASSFTFAGLENGPGLGSVTVLSANTGVGHYVGISLNAAGLAALNAAAGGQFNFGGSITTSYPNPETTFDNIAAFGWNGGVPEAYLEFNTQPVPEPETYAMMLAGLGMLGFMARRRKLKAAA